MKPEKEKPEPEKPEPEKPEPEYVRFTPPFGPVMFIHRSKIVRPPEKSQKPEESET